MYSTEYILYVLFYVWLLWLSVMFASCIHIVDIFYLLYEHPQFDHPATEVSAGMSVGACDELGVSCPRLRVFLILPDRQANLDIFSWHPQNTGGEMPAHPSFHSWHIC